MGKSFRDILSNAGYRTERADNPAFERVKIEDGLGAGTSSDSSGSDQGPSCKILDDVNGKVLKGSPTPIKDKIEVSHLPKKSEKNPFTGLELPSRDKQPNFT